LIWEATKKGWRTEPWKAAVQERLRLQPWFDEADEEILPAIATCPLFPDAWRFVIERLAPGCHLVLVLEFLEVEVTHYVTEHKWGWYAALWEMFDQTGRLEFRVVLMDRGGYSREADLDPPREAAA
jgi:hypothetical protein